MIFFWRDGSFIIIIKITNIIYNLIWWGWHFKLFLSKNIPTRFFVFAVRNVCRPCHSHVWNNPDLFQACVGDCRAFVLVKYWALSEQACLLFPLLKIYDGCLTEKFNHLFLKAFIDAPFFICEYFPVDQPFSYFWYRDVESNTSREPVFSPTLGQCNHSSFSGTFLQL